MAIQIGSEKQAYSQLSPTKVPVISPKIDILIVGATKERAKHAFARTASPAGNHPQNGYLGLRELKKARVQRAFLNASSP
jgi:hypothetical protein